MIGLLYSYPTWVAIISIYVIIDSLYLFIFNGYLKKINGFIANKKIFWTKCTIINIASAFFLSILMFSAFLFDLVDVLNDRMFEVWYKNIEYPILRYYIYDNVATFVWVLIGFVITIFVVYQIARRWIFNKMNIEKALIKKYALIFSIVTAPWMLLCARFVTKVEILWCHLFKVDGITEIILW